MAGLVLEAEEWAHLLRMMRRQTNSHVHRRMNVLLLLDDDWTLERIAEALYIDAETVREHRRRYESSGIAGLERLTYEGSEPAWFGGIALVGILLSIVDSIAGLALGVGTMMSRDIGRGVLHVTSGSRLLLINRVTVLVVTCLALVIALINADTFVLDWNYMSMTFRAAGVLIPLTLAIFWPRRLSGA